MRALIALWVVAAVSIIPAITLAQTDQAERGVPYLTVRDRAEDTTATSIYGDGRGSLKAGWCDVTETKLSVLSPLANVTTFRIPEEILSVETVREKPVESILGSFEATTGSGSPLLYTHGFFIDFDKGCRRATALQENIGIPGQFLWFSWPSDGAILNYTLDESDLYWSVPEMTDAIIQLVDRFGQDRVSVAGHSLGGRGLVLALNEVASQKPNLRLAEIVLLAPDMDIGIFEKMLPRIRPIAGGITVYVNEDDYPLDVSERLHGYDRLGQGEADFSNLSGVEVIDVSQTPQRSPTGHLYHIYNPEVGADLNQLLTEGLRASERANLTQTEVNVWQLTTPETEN